MRIFPAIDLKNGQCVRLRQGRADAVTVYSADPVETARRWADEGAEVLHLVDLDGAFDGAPRHTGVIARIVREIGLPVQVGGGLRTDAQVQELLDVGAWRVILGTRALSEPDALGALTARHGDAIVVGIDARDGRVQVKGWVETTRTSALDLARSVAELGVRTIIYTDTATDGMLVGPNLAALDTLCQAVPQLSVVASGGVAQVDDIRALRSLGRANLEGAIVGKALYEGSLSLSELLEAARGPRASLDPG